MRAMINSLHASVTFVTPIKTTVLKVDFSPQPGITAVVGRNGTGKSWSVIEVPRFLLFGKKALRGLAADYKTMEAIGEFTFGGRVYKIERMPKYERITDDTGTVQAVGAEAVTAKVVELLGYGLAVFDLCNASVQKKTDMLGQMLPSARKKLVDDVVGLADYEIVEKACRAEATGFRREAEALTKALRAPGDAPVKPQNKSTPSMLRAAIQLHVEVEGQWANWNAKIYRGMPRLQPMMPRTDPAELDRIEKEESARAIVMAERRRLDNIMQKARRFVPDCLPEAQLVQAEERLRVMKSIRDRGPAPRFTAAQSEAMWAAHALVDAYQPSDEVQCPECGTSFHPTGTPPAGCDVSKDTLREDDRRRMKWNNGEEIPIPSGPDLSAQQIAHMRESNANTEEFNQAAKAHAELVILPDQSSLLGAMRGAIPVWAAYDAEMKQHEIRVAESKAAEEALATLGPRPSREELEALQQALSEAEAYERGIVRYQEDVARFNEASAEINRVSKLADKFKEGGDALSDARATLKAHLAPLLSRVASSLIYDMTAGELSSVVVDDDMEITVDGQKIETLSGAGETVANLALRLGLGQVLVANTFPVFLGDEIDSDADDQRRAATKLAIQSLRSKLDQIILVSHRQIDIADHVLDLDVAQ